MTTERPMSDTPCVCGCGQGAATIERLRERLAKVEALVDTWDARDVSYTDAVGLAPQVGLYEVVRELRTALAPQNHPRSAVDAPEAPGQPGRGEEGLGGRAGHEWGDITTVSDSDRHYVCSQCGATKTEPRCTEATDARP